MSPAPQLWIAVLLSSLPACAAGGPAELPVGRAAEPIVDGVLEPGMPAVVALVNRDSGGLCTATVVSPHVVLTAKHCVQGPGAESPDAPEAFVVGVGPGVETLERTLDVVTVETTDGVWDLNGMGGTTGALLGVDVAVVTLAGEAGVAPVPMHREPVSGFVGVEVTVVGYGRTPEGDNANKYRTTTLVTAQSGQVLLGQAAVCTGDSGGPVIDEAGDLVAVSSLGPASCGDGPSAFNLFQRQLDLIDGAVRAAGDCVDERREICDGDDDDCDGEIDEGCARLGEACGSDEECAGGGPCEDGACTAVCDPLDPSTGCEDGFYCARSGCEGRCLPGVAGTAAHGAPCRDDTDCATLHCVDPGDGRRRCLVSCRGGEASCLHAEACAATEGACGACVAAALVSPRRLGEGCEVPDDCVGGLCHDAPGGASYCTRACTGGEDCAAGWRCEEGSCAPPAGAAGADERCDALAPCAEGLLCQRGEDGAGSCVAPPPPSGDGGCSAGPDRLASGMQTRGVCLALALLLALRRRRPRS